MSLLERMIARRAVAEAMSGTAGDVQETSQATQQEPWACNSCTYVHEEPAELSLQLSFSVRTTS